METWPRPDRERYSQGKPLVTDLEARRAIVRVVLRWLSGNVPTEQFIDTYWKTRRDLLDSNWRAFEGAFGKTMSSMDTAVDSYRAEDRTEFEIDEPQLRFEAEAVIARLRDAVPQSLD